jgi:hypothetical protein
MFQWVRNVTFLQNHPIQVKGRCTVALVRESLMLEGKASSIVFTIVNSVCSLKEYSLPLSVFIGEDHQICAKLPHSKEWKSTVAL